ncbi:MAG: hypothetical protein FOGNACKC_05199 [Anaerolineae bacterium]|nr:hypothetical protein [Anaerolineae bacterium]
MISLPHQTRIAVSFIIEDDTGSVVRFLTALTSLIGLLLATAEMMNPLFVWMADIIEAASFTLKVFIISVNALAFGLGVRL